MKKIIFFVFPLPARFLGLGLKILFHKNKEIKRMLSKKMTVSLMSLITIIALAFSVSPAMADPMGDHPTGLQHGEFVKGHAHFGTTLSYDEAENVDGRQVDVTIKFDKVVSETAVQAVIISVIVRRDNFESTTYAVTGILPATDEADGDAVPDFGPVKQKDIDPSTAGGQFDGKTFTFTIPDDVLPRADLDAGTPVLASADKILCVYTVRYSES